MDLTRTEGVHESVSSGDKPNYDAQAGQTNQSTEFRSPILSGAESSSLPTGAIGGKKSKKMPLRSVLWSHFERVHHETGTMQAICNNCQKSFPCSSKSNDICMLEKHANTCLQRKKTDSSPSESNMSAGGDSRIWKYEESAVRNAMAHYLVVDELPFEHVEKDGFRHFMSVACPRFCIPSRSTIARDIFQQFEFEKLALKDLLRNNEQRVCITTHTWTSVQNLSCMSVTAHYIDKNWKLQKRILNVCPITSHRGEDIGKAVESCLLEWGLENILTVTIDNASADDVVIEYLKKKVKNWGTGVVDCKYMHMRCVACIVNLVIVDGLKQQEAKDAVEKIRFAVSHVLKSTQGLLRFKKCIERAKIESRAVLRLDVSTVWTSTYLMLEAAEKFEKAFEIYAEEDPHFNLELLELGCGLLEENDWIIGRRLVTFLKNIYWLIKSVSGSSYVTANIFDSITLVIDWLEEWCVSDDTLCKSMAVTMKNKYEKYWGDLEKMNMLTYIGSILNPQYKYKYVEFVVNDLCSSNPEVATEICNQVKDSLNELYKWYEGKLKRASTGATTIADWESWSEMRKKYYLMVKSRTDLEKYLKEEIIEVKGEFDLLEWWKTNSQSFPILSEMARDVLAVPMSTIPPKSAFTSGGRVVNDFRSSLSPQMVECLLCSQSWLRKKISPTRDEECEENIQELEKAI